MNRNLLSMVAGFVFISSSLSASSGSMNLGVGTRFFNDERLGNKTGFRDGFIPEFSADFGVYRFPYRLEPIVGVSYIFNDAPDCAVDVNGNCITGNSTDRLKYHLLGFSIGGRWKAWNRDFFLVSPYLSAAMTYSFMILKRDTASVTAKKKIYGGEFGGDLQVGILTSFMFDRDTETEMNAEWSLTDYGMSLFYRYKPSGLFQHGMSDLVDTGGWGFGGGIYTEW